jgi:2-oxoglutarate dehydrogenase E2 component (dihydrolipoamide succinyltransferase)
MPVDVKIPQLGESVTEGVIVRWLAEDGAEVAADEPLLEIETEKAAMEINAEAAGRLHIVKAVGSRVRVGEVVATIAEAAAAGEASPAKAEAPASAAPVGGDPEAAAFPAGSAEREAPEPVDWRPRAAAPRPTGNGDGHGTPRRTATQREREAPEQAATAMSETGPARAAGTTAAGGGTRAAGEAEVERVPMSELRRTVAARLVQARQTAAIVTTFNEIDLGDLLAARARNRERFKERHGVDLGLVSLFARATVLATREVPVVNARIDGDDIVYHRRVHLGIAVSTRRGLVVPVVRDADAMSVAQLEQAIGERAARAREGRLTPDDLAGGTFTITNGGVFGSLLSTPLLNPPQSGILGMHTIQERPVAREGQVVIRPMMYVALSYDHRLVDGEQAVTFLKRVKEVLEDPARMAFES